MLREGFVCPAYLNEGDKVIIPYRHEGKMYGLKCTVVAACGDAGRVVNEKRGVNKWVSRYDMAIEVKKDNHESLSSI